MTAVKDNREKVKGVGKGKEKIVNRGLPLGIPGVKRIIARSSEAEKGAPGDHRQKEKIVVARHAGRVRGGVSGARSGGELKPRGACGGESGTLKALQRGGAERKRGRPGNGGRGFGAAKEKHPGQRAGGVGAKKRLVEACHHLRVR